MLPAQPPDPSNEQEYVRRCLESEFTEEQETRTFRSDPAFASVLTPLNSKQYTQAISAAQALLPRFNDLDLIYSWLGSAYRQTQRFAESRAVLMEGLAKAKRKSLLLTRLGEIEWESGDINGAVYWRSQALHCRANQIEYNPYLFLSYVAKGLGLADFERSLLARVDSLRSGQIRLDPMTARRLTALVQNKRTEAMRKVLQGLQSKYFSTRAAAAMPGENQLQSAVIDVVGGFAYFGTSTKPGIVVKVRLSDMTRVGALTPNPGRLYGSK